MSGFPGNLSASQAEKLKKFKSNLSDVLKPEHDDIILLKFLRARRFDLKKAEKMFRMDIKWREENKVSTILEWYKVPEVFEKYWCGGVCGLDKEGHALYISPVGNFDPKGVLFSAKASDILKTYTHSIEFQIKKHRRLSEEKGVRHTEGSMMIFDMENLGVHHLWKPGIDMFIKGTWSVGETWVVIHKAVLTLRTTLRWTGDPFLHLMMTMRAAEDPEKWSPADRKVVHSAAMLAEQHYPELIYRLFIIRAPKIFPVAYSLVKPFLREDTRKKIQVLGSNWKEVILKQIDPDQLPVYWGGTKKDPDGNEMCASMIKVGGKIPKSYYLKDREPPHTLTSHQVSRGGVIEFKYEVKNPNSVMRYEFQTDCNDIKFGFDRVDCNGKKTAILKLEKYNSHMVPENGEIMIAEPGTYVARFDNTHSWTKSKKLSYWLELLEPSDVEPEFQEMMDGVDAINLSD